MTRSDTTLDPTWTYDFLSGPTAAREVLDDLAARSSAANHSSGLQTDLQIVLAEVLNNVVEHAYGEIPGKPIQLAVTDRRDSVAVHVCDHGVSMPNGTLPGASFPALPAVDLPEGGFGWAMVHAMTSDLTYQRIDGQNHLTFCIEEGDET